MERGLMGATEVIAFFRKQFGFKPTYIVQAPGRLELLGNHTDYNQGLVLALAVDKHIHMASSPRTDVKIELASTAFPEREFFSATNLRKNPGATWADYVKGVLDQLRKRHVHPRGFNAAIHADIPMGAGMSSSAALEVATALTVRHLTPYSLRPNSSRTPPLQTETLPELKPQEMLETVKLCQAAENDFVGVK